MKLRISTLLALVVVCSSFNSYLNYRKGIRVAEIYTQSDEALMLSIDRQTASLKDLKERQALNLKAVKELNAKMQHVYNYLEVKEKIDEAQ